MNGAVHVPHSWILAALGRIDGAGGNEELAAAARAAGALLGSVALNFRDLGRAFLQEPPQHLLDDAPVTFGNVRALIDQEYDRLPIRHLPALGNLSGRLRVGNPPTAQDCTLVRDVRAAVRATR